MQSEIDRAIYQFGQDLILELNQQGTDASNQGDRQTALVLQRVSNAINSLFERRAARAESMAAPQGEA